MNIPQHRPPHSSGQALEGFPDDRRAQMADVQGFRDVGTAIVDQDRAAWFLWDPEMGVLRQFGETGEKRGIGQGQVEETRRRRVHPGKQGIPRQNGRHLPGNRQRCLMIAFRAREGAVALELAQIQPVGTRHLPPIPAVSASFESIRHHITQLVCQRQHIARPSLEIIGIISKPVIPQGREILGGCPVIGGPHLPVALFIPAGCPRLRRNRGSWV